jgi:hypothetical protein
MRPATDRSAAASTSASARPPPRFNTLLLFPDETALSTSAAKTTHLCFAQPGGSSASADRHATRSGAPHPAPSRSGKDVVIVICVACFD